MRLNDNRTIIDLIPKIAQSLAPDGLLALVAVSKVLGHEFYRLRPRGLLLCLPAYFVILSVRMLYYVHQEDCISIAHRKSPQPTGKSQHQNILHFEKNIYLLIYFISDVISCFELSSILAISLFELNLMYVYTAFFPFSVLFAAFIHTTYREPDFRRNYDRINHVMWNEKPKLPLDTGIASISTFFCLIASIAVFDSLPALGIALFILGTVCCYRYIRENIYSMYGLFLFDFAMSRLTHFNQLLIHQLRHININASLPFIAASTHFAVSSLALLYAIAYLNSTSRFKRIRQYQKDPHVSPSQKTYI